MSEKRDFEEIIQDVTISAMFDICTFLDSERNDILTEQACCDIVVNTVQRYLQEWLREQQSKHGE